MSAPVPALPSFAIEFRAAVERVYGAIPECVRKRAHEGATLFRAVPGTSTDQCPGCGVDIADAWKVLASEVGELVEEGDEFGATCSCGFRAMGKVVSL